VRIVEEIVRFGVSMEKNLLAGFDELISSKGYANRSEALRDLVRDHLVEEEWRVEKKEMIGTITIVYNHHTRGLSDTLIELQHHFHNLIVSTMHLHMDEDNCLEVLVVKGMVDKIKTVADKLISTRGVKHGKLTMTTTGKELP
jgi:CopG family nickel-responsive transcriptional regulator